MASFSRFLVQGEVMEPVLLHGTLQATIYEIDHIPCNFFSKVWEWIACGTKLYTTINLEGVIAGGSRLIKFSSNPQWNESFHIYVAHMASHVIFSIKQESSQFGTASIPVKELFDGKPVDKWLEIFDEDSKPRGSRIHVKLQFFHVTSDSNWSRGLISPEYSGVPYTSFTQKNGCRVSLYQDAHIPTEFLPCILLGVPKRDEPDQYEEARGGGNTSDEYCPKFYEPQRCWEDVCDAISNAKHFIYVTGWSVYTEITLVRDSTGHKAGGDISLGELLKKKASQGVKVLILVWDDKTSFRLFNQYGLMGTHDEETRKYFRNTDVHCVLCPRHPNDGSDFVQNWFFTHHQKIVVVDSEIPNGETEQRRIVSFIGGIDLCDGRYDTPVHSLFRTLDAEHSADFHQPNFAGASITKGGPREPWHDIHCKLEGPIAWDVFYNFEQRWKKQGGDAKLIIDLDTINIIRPSPFVLPEEDHETWNVQLFRSIDTGATFGFPDNPEDVARKGLVREKENIIDRGIQDAYINAIRRSKNFIYIETQYFVGSSFFWDSNVPKVIERVVALHLIPKELSLKIVSKIKANERFTVYIVIPMWPEGLPDNAAVQTILYWQQRTMAMMYSEIVQALRDNGLESKNPKDYLTFFCLGNREEKKSGEYAPPEGPKHNTDYSRAQQARRFMIYLHSKMMIVDDEYIIIGSANMNQRSMDGGRDTEIAMGGYQPYHLDTEQHRARGQIYGFRMALWYEHLGMIHNSFYKPESLECVQEVNQIAEKYWGLYSSETLEDDLPGHLLTYPIRVTEDGKVVELPGTEYFPDTKARILGNKSWWLPSRVTAR